MVADIAEVKPEVLVTTPLGRLATAFESLRRSLHLTNSPDIRQFGHDKRTAQFYDQELHAKLSDIFTQNTANPNVKRLFLSFGKEIYNNLTSRLVHDLQKLAKVPNEDSIEFLSQARELSSTFVNNYLRVYQGKGYDQDHINKLLELMYHLELYRVKSLDYLQAYFTSLPPEE